MPAKAVHLISPGYRRWLTPDFLEIEFELEGFAANDQTPWQAHLFVRDLDSEAETRSITPLDGTPKRFVPPAPKFHRRAEVVCMIEDRRTKEPICEGRWNLTNIPKEDLPNLSYFDSRGVFFHEGVGRFPIIASPVNDVKPETWQSFAKAGYTGLAVPQGQINDQSAALASGLKLLLFAALGSPTNQSSEKRKAEVRRIARYSAVAGYGLAADPTSLSVCRATDPSRPTIAVAPAGVNGGELSKEFEDFEDVVAIEAQPPKGTPWRPSLRRFGRQFFCFVEEATLAAQGLNPHLYTAVARGASAFTITGDASKLTSASVSAALKDAVPLVNAVVRGIPERSDDSTDDHWFWRRRLGPRERAVIEVKRTDPPTAAFTVFRDSL